MRGFGFGIASESREAAIGATIGVQHQDNALGVVQAHGRANLFQHKLTVGLEFRRGQAFGPTGNLDGIGMRHADAFEEFAKPQVKAVIETPKDRRVAIILLPRSFKMKNLFHDGPPTERFFHYHLHREGEDTDQSQSGSGSVWKLTTAETLAQMRSRSLRKSVFVLAVADDQHSLAGTIAHDELESVGAGIDGDE